MESVYLLSHLGSPSLEVSDGERGPARAGGGERMSHRESGLQLVFVNKDFGGHAVHGLEGLGLPLPPLSP